MRRRKYPTANCGSMEDLFGSVFKGRHIGRYFMLVSGERTGWYRWMAWMHFTKGLGREMDGKAPREAARQFPQSLLSVD